MKLKLTPEQHAALLGGIFRGRVSHDPQGHSHLEQWDVRRTLIRIFGFGGWEDETLELALAREIEYPPGTTTQTRWSDKPGGGRQKTQVPNERTLYTVVYRAQVRLTVYGLDGTSASYDDGAIGKSENQPSLGDAHDQALKTAQSQALKRCAVNLGDQFGMSLYNGGEVDPVVVRTLVGPVGDVKPAAELPRDDAPVRPEPGTPAPDDDGQTYVDEQDGQRYQAPPSGGLADDMRGADVHPLPPERPRRLDVSSTPADHIERARQDLDELAARRAPTANGHAAGQLPPPAGVEPLHVAGARAIERARAHREQTRPQPQPRREPEQPAPRPAPAGDPETADLVDAIMHASSADQIARLWAQSASVRPEGRRSDVRGYLADVDVVVEILGEIFAGIKVDPRVAIPVGALVVAAGRHLEVESTNLRDHIAAATAAIDPATGRAVTPPADAVPAQN